MITNIEKKIERYIAGEMLENEAKEFENLMALNEEVFKDYEKALAARQLIIHAGRQDLKSKLESFDLSLENSSKQAKSIPLWVKKALPIAAILIVFFGVYQFMIINRSITTAEVFNTYYKTYSSPDIVRGLEETSQINWETAITQYNKENYEQALLYFEASKGEAPNYLVLFYTGVSSLSQKSPDYKKALISFENVLKIDNDYHQQAEWYKGLTLLKLDKKDEALAIFKTISTNKSYNYLKAEELLELKIIN